MSWRCKAEARTKLVTSRLGGPVRCERRIRTGELVHPPPHAGRAEGHNAGVCWPHGGLRLVVGDVVVELLERDRVRLGV